MLSVLFTQIVKETNKFIFYTNPSVLTINPKCTRPVNFTRAMGITNKNFLYINLKVCISCHYSLKD